MNPSQQLTLFTEDSLDFASRSPWLVSGKDGTTLDSCGLSFRGWSERLARVGLLLRTYLASFPLPPMTSARIWSVSVTRSGFGILKLYLSGRRTGGHGYSSWHILPTPTANDAKCNGTASQQNRNSAALNVVAGSSLNPEWVEVLMGFPRGWTEIGKTGSPEQPEASPTGWRD